MVWNNSLASTIDFLIDIYVYTFNRYVFLSVTKFMGMIVFIYTPVEFRAVKKT